MEAKIKSITKYNPQTLTVAVDFLDGETIAYSKTYPLSVIEGIESLYPDFKEDINKLETRNTKFEELQSSVNVPIDLSAIKSRSEIQAEEAAKVEVETPPINP